MITLLSTKWEHSKSRCDFNFIIIVRKCSNYSTEKSEYNSLCQPDESHVKNDPLGKLLACYINHLWTKPLKTFFIKHYFICVMRLRKWAVFINFNKKLLVLSWTDGAWFLHGRQRLDQIGALCFSLVYFLQWSPRLAIWPLSKYVISCTVVCWPLIFAGSSVSGKLHAWTSKRVTH